MAVRRTTVPGRCAVAEPREEIIGTLRGRVLRGVQAGTLRTGDRLPSARELAREFVVDYRVVLDAYRELAAERLVEMRARGGVYVATPRPGGGVPPLPERWLADTLAAGLAREIPGPELHEWLRRCVETLRLRAVVVSTTSDQVHALCRELRDDFGFEADGILAQDLRDATAEPLVVRRADLLVATAAYGDLIRTLGRARNKAVCVVEVRPDLSPGEWALLLRRPVYAVVATPAFGELLRTFFADVPGVENLRILVFGHDDLGVIPEGAPTYVTQRVRDQLRGVHLRGRILPAVRTIAPTSARELFSFIVRSNAEALVGSRS